MNPMPMRDVSERRQWGGGLRTEGGSTTLTECDFESNKATRGGAIFFLAREGMNRMRMTRCSFTGNWAQEVRGS